jgi:glyoxylase-like metal-dependent hydrolase (beta-lactamase superfamily II)
MPTEIAFRKELAFEYGRVERLSPLIRRVVARNPSPFTFKGTGTYVVGNGRVAVIDPGPALPEHVDALLAGLDGETVEKILVTHTHLDHSPAAAELSRRTGAPVLAFGPHGTPPSAGPGAEAGADFAFAPDRRLGDGDAVEGPGWHLTAVHTPGHTSNHLCFALAEEQTLFTGDHVMGWSTSVIVPPDGDMRAYRRSLARLLERGDALYWPAHGPSIPDPKPFVASFLAHRAEREAAILDRLRHGDRTTEEMVTAIYRGLDPRLTRAAGRSVLAHLLELIEDGRVVAEGPATVEGVFRLA